MFISLLGMIRRYLSAGNLTAQFPGLQIVEALPDPSTKCAERKLLLQG